MELQHFSHDHPLILNDHEKDGESSSIVCDVCYKRVSAGDVTYECRQCDFVLHKSCVELPKQIIHFSHLQHPLTLLSKSPYKGKVGCNNCGERILGFIYHCSVCKYDVDVECVQQRGQIVNREGHKHSYIPIRSWPFTCGACERTGEGICYMCSSCQLVIHIDCASHPKADSSFHTFNLLSMFPTIECVSLEKTPSSSDLQNTMLDGVLDLDPFSENYLAKIKLQHLCHKHLLLYGDAKDKKDLLRISLMKCCLCREEITDGPIYSCDECGCYIHKVCSDFPRNTRDPLHSMHLLVLIDFISDDPRKREICSVCNEDIFGFIYRCSSGCDVYLHLKCAFENTFEPKKHKHTFINLKSISFLCDGCGVYQQRPEVVSCICSICQLHVHKKCNNAFPLSLTQRMHAHELKLSYSFEVDFEFADKFCKICSKKMNSVLCMYQCNDDACAYIAHATCSTSKDLVIHSIDGETCDNDGHNTMEANSSGINPFEVEHIEMEQAITHFSHPHPLIISNNEPKVDEPPKICYGCVRPISHAPFYTCGSDECTFFLHQQCFDLQKTIQHPLHRHPLVLKDFPDLSVINILGFECRGCYGKCNGFAYTCLECSYILDVGCALFSQTLKHESHKCTLTLISIKDEDKTCRACESKSSTGFWCEECDFYIDLKCASLPTSVGHECPTGTIWYVKPIKLWYDCIEHVDGQYYCDLCAEPRGKDQWFYHCEDCHESIHPQCLLGDGRFKYVDSYYTFAKHPHTVRVEKKPRTDPLCGTCSEPCKDSPLVFCPTCNAYFHDKWSCFYYWNELGSKPLIRDYFAAAQKLDL